ncbi:MAG: phosphoribosyltransferase family protein [Thermoflexales bacterium]|nr:phosphoribosyltransferase family protein [Thermoflexales bacterium]
MGVHPPAFLDRVDAGRRLAQKLLAYTGHPHGVVLALPRGGVVIGAEVARALHLPLDVLVVRKLGVPEQPELAMGAISGSKVELWRGLIEELGITPSEVALVIEREAQELRRREQRYRSGLPPLDLEGKLVIVVDDGVATGATMRVALRVVQQHKPAYVIAAAPVMSPESAALLEKDANLVVSVILSDEGRSVGAWYRDFSQVSDEEVITLLAQFRNPPSHSAN